MNTSNFIMIWLPESRVVSLKMKFSISLNRWEWINISLEGFPISPKGWASGWNTGSELRAMLDGNDASYEGSVKPIMIRYYENHDHDRAYHVMGDDMNTSAWNLQTLFLFQMGTYGCPYIYWGDERAMMGRKNLTYPGWEYTDSTSKFGSSRAFPWDYDGAVGWIDYNVIT